MLPLLVAGGAPSGLAETSFQADLVFGGRHTPRYAVRLAADGVWFGRGERLAGWTPVLKLRFVDARAVGAVAEHTSPEGAGRWIYRDLWPGIDLVYEVRDGQLKYSFVVQPGVDPGRIRWFYDEATGVQVAKDRSLVVATAAGLLQDDEPFAYQEEAGTRRQVQASFALEGDGSGSTRVGFEVGPYDPSRPLILDPVVKLIGFETLDASEIVSLGAGASISATVRAGSGQRSLQQGATASVLANGLTLSTLGLRFSFRKPSDPGANQQLVLFVGAANQWALQLTTTGRLQLQDLAGLTFVGTTVGGTALANATWYTVRVAYNAAAGGGLQVWLDGSLEIGVTHSVAGTAVNQMQVLAAAALYNYDDFHLTDTATQPPLGQIVRIGVDGSGYRSDFDTAVGSGLREANVDEIPPSDADYNQHGAATAATDLYALQPSPAGTINAVKGMWRMSRGTGSATGGTHDYAWRVLGVEGSQAFAAITTSFTLAEAVWTTPPGVAGTWNRAEVDGLELGAKHNGTQGQDTLISWTAAMVDYGAGGAGGPTCGAAGTKPWYNPSWTYRQPILIDHTKVVGDLVDFPVLVSRTADAGLAAHARPNGFDILFTDEDGTTKLSHQREAYDGAGNLVAWVKLPLLPTGVDKLIFMYYGNLSATDQQSINATWTNGYRAVWHLSEASGTGAYILNSALNDHHGTPNGPTFNAAGKIDGARTFSDVGYSNIDPANSGALFNGWSQFAFEFWIYPDYASDVLWEGLGEDGFWYGNVGPVRLGRVRRFNWDAPGTGELQIDVQFNTAGTFFWADSINRAQWNHVVYTYQGSDFQLFFNGVEVNRTVLPNDSLISAAYYALLGHDSPDSALRGSLDEVRISNAGRSSEWIRTEYANQNAPASFCSVCYEQDVATTAVRLMSFEAAGSDRAVDVTWRTGSEVDNLGFNLYRGPAEDGPWTRLNASLVPGQGFSASGAAYAWHDGGLENGRRYFYRLEDVDSHALSTLHGPVSAVPQPGAVGASATVGGSAGGGTSATDASSDDSSCPAWALAQLGASVYRCQAHGASVQSTFRVLSRTPSSVQVELETPGFLAARDAAGRVRVLIPDFDSLDDPRAPALPRKRAVLDAVVGRKARIRSVQARGLSRFPGLRPAATGEPQALVFADGTVRPGRRPAGLPVGSRGLLPGAIARLAGESFLGEEKTLALELVPLRYDAARGSLVLARRLLVTVDFGLREPTESGRGREGRRVPETVAEATPLAFLATSALGLHAASFESLFPARRQPLRTAALRLTRDRGRTIVPFHVEPDAPAFGPGSRLFFHADRAPRSTAFSSEVVYALESGTGGIQMGPLAAAPDASAPARSRASAAWETNRIYLPNLLEAQDLWQWEFLGGGMSTTKPFSLRGLDASASESARLVVQLQGGSDAAAVVDHHVRVLCNGAPVAEESFDGALPHAVTVELPASLLRTEAPNELTVQNVGDTGVVSSVFLDRFELSYPQTGAAQAGLFDGVFSSAGTAEVTELPAPAAVVDVTSGSWLTRYESGPRLRFRTEAGHRYLAAASSALFAPRVFFPQTSGGLRQTGTQADYVLVAPQAFLDAVQPLLARRQSQGLTTLAASLEEIASAFGGGEASAEAIRDFLAFAYHRWQRPSPRYALLVGDSNYDPRHFNPASQPAPLPFLLQKSSYLWTASDPALGAVNGDDPLPDLALGRLPATNVEQARAMVAKILDWEDQGYALDGPAALVADNPDAAGDFEADVRDIQSSFLSGRPTSSILLGPIGSRDVARQRILAALDSGLSLISYVGHGGAAVWASENILNSWDAQSLVAQPRQPLMLTLSCLNGYFIAPGFDSLAEAFLKAEGRGTIAAIAPSGLSLDGPAHLYHRAVVQEITSSQHERLGDALVAAQKRYLDTGAFPELLDLYQLLGDPALKLR